MMKMCISIDSCFITFVADMFHLKAIIFCFSIFLQVLFYSNVFAQSTKKIQVENANSLEYDDALGIKAQRLIGSVVFNHEGTRMYCDSAYLDGDNNSLEAFSNIRIVGDSVNLTGNHLDYDGKLRHATVTGNVVLTDPSTVLTTDLLIYDTKNEVARYTTGGKIMSKTNSNVLTSLKGTYESKSRFFYFKKNVVLKNDDYTMYSDTLHYNSLTEVAFFYGPTRIIGKENLIYCENGYYDTKNDISQFNKNAVLHSKGQRISGQWLYYDRVKGIGRARDNVVIIDSTQNVVITGNYADYFEKEDRMLVTRNAMLKMEIQNDTLYLVGDTLKNISIPDTEFKKLFANYNVRFYKTDLQGQCDSLTYSTQDSLMEMFREPVLWNEENQLNADSCKIQMANGDIDKIYLNQNAFIGSEVDSIRFNQIKGRKITGYFFDKQLRKIFVEGNGQSIYYAESDSAEYIGVNKADCTDMIIYIDSSQVSSIIFIKDPDATLYPVNELSPKELMLRGFKWLGALRATRKEDLMN
jgi:lipopolysaccharide export system protein LptA